jgi:hypothetical protein
VADLIARGLTRLISVGRASTPEQEQFITAIEKYLSSNGLTPQTVGRTYFKNQQPLESVAECMAGCAGTIILAFERLYIQDGAERRGSKQQNPLGNVTLPTVWNQIEAAMAYTLGHPLLVLVDECRQFRLLVRSQNLHHLRRDAGVLHRELSHGLSLLRGQLAGFGFIEVAAHHQVAQLRVSLGYLQHQRLQGRLFLRHDRLYLHFFLSTARPQESIIRPIANLPSHGGT